MRFFMIIVIISLTSCYSFPPTHNNSGITGFPDPSSYFERSQKPGAVYAAFNKNGEIFVGSWGWANLEERVQMRTDTPVIIASVSKVIVGVALMQLVDRGKINIDDSVDKYLDRSLRNPKFPKIEITIRMLLTHTSGLAMNWMVLYPLMGKKDPESSLQVFVNNYFYKDGKYYRSANFSDFAPGTEFDYSNIGITLLAHIVEKASNSDFKEYCKKNIFTPLAMNNSSWFLTSEVSNYAIPYENFVGFRINRGYYNAPFYPAGFLKTTAGDLAKLGVMLLQAQAGIDESLLSKNTVIRMIEPQLGVVPENWDQMGLIMQISTVDSRKIVGHTGGLWGMASLFFIDYASGSGALILTNGDWKSDTGYRRLNEKPMCDLLFQLIDFARLK